MNSKLDPWMAANPWHPRLTPYFVYVGGLFILSLLPFGWHLPATALYVVQVLIVAWLLWRARGLLPEMNLKFHWLAVPTAIGLTAAWVGLGKATATVVPAFAPDTVTPAAEQHRMPAIGEAYGQAAMWTALSLRLLGMALVVPVFEELFMRSAMVRGLHRPGPTGTGILQLLSDLPVVGDLIGEREAVRRANQQPAMLTKQLVETPVGALTLFAVAASTLVFAAGHHPRDWAGCIACGVVWCGLLWWTNRGRLSGRGPGPGVRGPDGGAGANGTVATVEDPEPGTRNPTPALGLGPIIWSHGLTNALLWGWVVYSGEWYWL